MGQSLRWRFQNWRLFKSCQIVGEKKKPSGHELWQAEQIYPPVLQKGYHKENGAFKTTCISILSAVSVKKGWSTMMDIYPKMSQLRSERDF